MEIQLLEVCSAKSFVKLLVSGKITKYGDTETFQEALGEYFKAGYAYYLLDLSRVSYINSIGINSIASLVKQAKESGGEVIFYDIEENVEDAMKITCMHYIASFCGSEKEAIKHTTNQ